MYFPKKLQTEIIFSPLNPTMLNKKTGQNKVIKTNILIFKSEKNIFTPAKRIIPKITFIIAVL